MLHWCHILLWLYKLHCCVSAKNGKLYYRTRYSFASKTVLTVLITFYILTLGLLIPPSSLQKSQQATMLLQVSIKCKYNINWKKEGMKLDKTWSLVLHESLIADNREQKAWNYIRRNSTDQSDGRSVASDGQNVNIYKCNTIRSTYFNSNKQQSNSCRRSRNQHVTTEDGHHGRG